MTKGFPVTQFSRVYQCPPADGDIPLPLSPTLKISNPVCISRAASIIATRKIFFFFQVLSQSLEESKWLQMRGQGEGASTN